MTWSERREHPPLPHRRDRCRLRSRAAWSRGRPQGGEKAVSTVLERYSCGCRILFSPEGGRIPDWCDRHSGGGTPIRWISREEAEELYPDEIRLGERMLRELAN